MESNNVLQYIDTQGRLLQPLPESLQSGEWLVQCYRNMVLARVFDNKAVTLQRTGQLGTYASLLGSEAIDVPAAMSMTHEDVLIPYYRNHACQMIRGMSLDEILLYWGGDERGNASQGQKQDLPNAVPIATQCLHACGVASAMKIRHQNNAAITFIGDGGTSKGDFMEALNIAGVWQLPVIFIINNNQWAISVPRSLQCAADKLSDKAVAAGIPGVQVDGNDAIAMYQAVQTGLQKAYQGKGPTLIEALSYRLADHTTADDATRYRDNAQLKSAWEKEPIKRLRTFLSAQNLWNESEEKTLQDTTEKQVQSAIDNYLNTPTQPVESMFDYLYSELPEQLIPQKDWATVKAMPGGSHYKEEQS